MSSSALDVLNHYKRKIERKSSDPEVLLHCLNKLDAVKVNIALLQETGVGRTVNGLKKGCSEEVSAKARELVSKWKEIVATEEGEEEEEHQGTTSPAPAPPDNDDTEEDFGEPPHLDREDEAVSNHVEEEEDKRKKEHKHHHHHKSKKHKKEKKRTKEEEKEKSKSSSSKKSSSSSSSSRSKDHRNGKDHHHKKSSSPSKKRATESEAFAAALEGLENGLSDKDSDVDESPALPVAKRSRLDPEASTSSSLQPSSCIAPPVDISPNYKPLPRKKEPLNGLNRKMANQTEDEALSTLLTMSKTGRRTAVYSGVKRTGYTDGKVPSLKNMCIHILQENVDSIDECGLLSFDVLKPVLERANPRTLSHIEECNPYLLEDTGELWQRFCQKHFPKEKKQEMETFRDMFERCEQEREAKLLRLKDKVKDSYAREKNSQRKSKLAYVGGAPKPPRNVMRAQANNGTALPLGRPMAKGSKPLGGRPSGGGAGGGGGGGSLNKKPKVAPLWSKTLKLAKGLKGGFRR